MTEHKIGLHWIRVHPDGGDLAHIERMQYPSAKLFEWHWSDRDACAGLLSVLPKDAYILARDHPLSEQEIWADPFGTGKRHADEWADKVRTGRYHLPLDRSFFLGRNEPDATSGDRAAIDIYTMGFLDRLTAHGLRGGAFNFSTGHPRTVDGTPNTKADYTVFERSHQAIVRGHHIAVAHIYGTAAVPLAPGHFDRLRACPWQDVEWVIGEFGIDEHVIGGGPHIGFHGPYNGRLDDYCAWLDTAIMGIGDPRIHSYQVFTYDYSKPWDSFDVRAVRHALEAYPWQHVTAAAKPQTPGGYLPIVGGPTQPQTGTVTGPQAGQMPALVHPVLDARFRAVTQPYGANGAYYKQFAVDGVPLRGHSGVDFATPLGSQVVAVAEGRVVEAADDAEGYGKYIKLSHPWGESLYAHLSEQSVSVGQTVQQAQPLGRSGSSGNSTGPHLHFGLRIAPFDRRDGMGGFTDPLPYLTQSSAQPTQPIGVWPILQEAALEFGVDKYLLASLIWAESSFRPDAVSSAGAKGLGQLMPATWEEWSAVVGATNPFDARDNARVTAAYLAWLLRTLGNEWAALHAFVWGIGNVLAGKQPPDEAVDYVVKIVHGRDLLKAVVG